MQEQHGHCMLCNFPEQIASLQYAGQQLDQVDYSSSVEALQQHNQTKREVTSKAEQTSSSRSMSTFVKNNNNNNTYIFTYKSLQKQIYQTSLLLTIQIVKLWGKNNIYI